jgi:hypothetical protein
MSAHHAHGSSRRSGGGIRGARTSAVRALAWSALALSLALPATSCSRPRAPVTAPHAPLLLIGLDGAEWDVVLDMLHAGRLPVLAGLMKRGIYGQLGVTKPTLSPIIWTSIATGVGRTRHGIEGFVKPRPHGEHDGPPALFTSQDRRVKAFWNILSDYGRKNATVGWWITFPAERVDGVMVAQVNTITPKMRVAGKGIWKGELVQGLSGQVYPPSMEHEMLELVPEIEAGLDTFTERVFGRRTETLGRVATGFVEQSQWAFRADALYHVITRKLLTESGPFDLVAVYFGGADVVGHRFWRYMHPELYRHPPSANEQAALGDMVRAYYAYLDAVIGDLLDAAPDHTSVMIVSDHGMGATARNAAYRGPTLSGGHLDGPPALLVAAGPVFGKPAAAAKPIRELTRADVPRLGSIMDVTPTLLAVLDVPVGRDMQGHVLESVLDPTYMASRPVRFVPTHTEPGWWPRHTTGTEIDPEAAVERLEQLRALGYVD